MCFICKTNKNVKPNTLQVQQVLISELLMQGSTVNTRVGRARGVFDPGIMNTRVGRVRDVYDPGIMNTRVYDPGIMNTRVGWVRGVSDPGIMNTRVGKGEGCL